MSRKLKKIGLALVILFIAREFRGQALGQDAIIGTVAEINAAQTNFKDSGWHNRCDAFYGLLGYKSCTTWDGRTDLIPAKLAAIFSAFPKRENELTLALIELLNTETAVVEAQNQEYKRTRKTLTDDYTNYYGDLIAAVSGLKDSRALHSLVEALGTDGMATRALAEFGQMSLSPVLSKLQSRDSTVRAAAVRALNAFVQPNYRAKFSDDLSHQRIERALLKAATDQDWGVRTTAVTGLALIPDKETVAALKKLATSDQAKLVGREDGGGDFYPVRKAAKKALAQIEQENSFKLTSPR